MASKGKNMDHNEEDEEEEEELNFDKQDGVKPLSFTILPNELSRQKKMMILISKKKPKLKVQKKMIKPK